MKFLNPAGLWLLLGVPILIIIYLIKSQHEDHSVSSTYLWKLSARFMKRRLPVQRVQKLLLFLLQLLMIVAAALMVARPAVPSGEKREYIAVIDASGSMMTVDENGDTRFERAVKEVEKLAEKVNMGHTVSVILAGDNPVFLVRSATSVNQVRLALENAECGYTACNTASAMDLAQQACNDSTYAEAYFYTDQPHAESEGIEIVNLNSGEWNVSVGEISAHSFDEGTVFSTTVTSHNLAKLVNVGLKINGEVLDAQQVECQENVPTEVMFTVDDLAYYDTAEIYVEADDALAEDNSYTVCQRSTGEYSVLLISRTPLYLENAIKSLRNCEVAVVGSEEEANAMEGSFDLYVYDHVYPAQYPEVGSVIVFGTEGDLPDGISVGGTYETETPISKANHPDSELYHELALDNAVLVRYSELIGDTNWKTVLSCDGVPVLVTTKRSNGMYFSVASFDLHDSNLPLITDFMVLMRNLVEYSIPAVLKDTDHTIGETVELTVLPYAEQMYVNRPDGEVEEFSVEGEYCLVTPETIGVYTAVMTYGESGQYVDFFVHLPLEEMTAEDGGALELSLPENADVSGTDDDAMNELWFWFALALLVLLLTEWGVYYREQY